MENKGHVDGIKKSIEDIIGNDTILKSKKPNEEDIQKEKFEKIILYLEEVEMRSIILGIDFKLDLTEYDDKFYNIIDILLLMLYGKEASELIFFYLYDRINPEDNSINALVNDKGESFILNTPSDLWELIKISKANSKKKNNA